MFAEVVRFEIGYHRRQYLFYVLAGVFFLLAFLATTTPNVQLVGGVGNVNINSPYTVTATLASLSFLCLFGAIAFCANGVIRDHDLKVAELFMSTPVRKFDYVYGRFVGGMVFAFGLYFAGMLGVLIGEFMPWLDQERIGPTILEAYWFSTWAIALPNMLICCCLFFCIATVTRSMMATYVGMVVLLMLTFLLDTFTEKETVELTSILDPFGTTALEELTRYWTVFEKNGQVPALTGALLVNRLFWLVIGALFLIAAYPLYPFTLNKAGGSRKPAELALADEDLTQAFELRTTPVTLMFGLGAEFKQFLAQTKIEVKNIVFSVPFAILLLVGLFLVVANAIGNLGNLFGTSVYPTTTMMVAIINGAFSLSMLVVLIYYSGELLVREKNVQVSEIMDAMPFPNWVMMAAKITGLLVVIVAMLCAAMIAAIGVQLFKGYTDIDIGQYLAGLLFFFQFPLYLMAVLSIFFYILTRNKYAAMALMIVYFVLSLAAPQLGYEHYLYRMRELAPLYSDFTGYSHNLEPYLWQTAYWSLFGCLMLFAIHLLWPRGIEDDWGNRIKIMKQRMTRPVVVGMWATATVWILIGSWIFYNTVIVNDYVTSRDRQERQANFEKQYKQYEDLKTPQPVNVVVEVDIFPEERDVYVRGVIDSVNMSDAPINTVHFSHLPNLDFTRFELEGATLKSFDEALGYRIYEFESPLEPGASVRLEFDVAWLSPGFANNGHSVKVTPNGTFFNTTDVFPLPGYFSGYELQDNNIRRQHDLPPVERQPKIDDESEWGRSMFGLETRSGFSAVVSTSEDQIAIAPGYLTDEWVENGRRHFEYKMDEPIWSFLSFVSADYEVTKASWRDKVDIEVYYLHDYNIDTMIRSTQNSLDYFDQNFSPYQYRQFRIMEFPRYQGAFAQSFPNTIPFSEAIGFVADLRDPAEIDYVYYVTAHELAHQWWGHQIAGANVQGATMIVESLAQYSALMVMEEEYGSEQMKRFLSFELDRYLQDRGGELIDELPLFLVENQPYIHYRKGSVVLYALKDYIGEDRMNRALSNFLDEYAFKGPPYPTSLDLIAHIKQQAAPEHDALIADLLQKIVLFDLKVADSKVEALPDGKFAVTFDVDARKFEASGSGEEQEVPIANWIDVGVLGEEQGEAKVPEILYLEKHEITDNKQSLRIVVDKRPVSVGIDPLNKLIDRDPSDNVATISAS